MDPKQRQQILLDIKILVWTCVQQTEDAVIILITVTCPSYTLNWMSIQLVWAIKPVKATPVLLWISVLLLTWKLIGGPLLTRQALTGIVQVLIVSGQANLELQPD